MKKLTFLSLAAVMALAACKNPKPEEKVMEENPFFTESAAPFGAPEFDKIKTEHYLPAFTQGMKAHDDEIATITGNTAAPDFANTIVALDEAGALLDRVSEVFFNLNEAVTDSVMQAIADSVTPLLSAHYDAISMSAPLFARVKAVYDRKTELGLKGEDSMLLENTWKNFVRSGALLNDAQKEELKAINEKLSTLTLKFGQNVLDDNNAFKMFVKEKEELAGLPEGVLSAASEAAKAEGKEGEYLFTLHWPSLFPFLTYAENRALREKMYKGYTNRGNLGNAGDNNTLVAEIANLRQKKAALLGFESHAAFVLDRNMAKTPATVDALLEKLFPMALKRAKGELAEMQKLIDKEGGKFKLAPWDWWYYAEKVRKAKYDLDEEAIRPYFVMENVRDGAFDVARKLYGIDFKKRDDVPVYHKEVEVFEVTENGNHIGLLYLDYYPRESKRGGAWCTSFRSQRVRNGKKITPLVSLVCNFSKPTGGKPSLLSVDEVETFFHEFGHGLHGLFSNVTYGGTSGTPRDFVELPSQIMENWATEPEVMKSFAKHYQTGEVIPDALIAKMQNSQLFNQGFAAVEYMAASMLDMAYHSVKAPITVTASGFEADVVKRIRLMTEIGFRYRSTYFNHIFSGGYSAGYYSYLWSEILDADAFEAFKEKGIFDKATAQSFRDNILSKGGTMDASVMYRAFRGKDPSLEPVMKRKGLK
ncbi:MAG TPA: M3 family metallopeptidase [Bacteroidales bacterium]|nr:M3 family metallopeptidase [Bacteroidales bacterium]HRZ48399.1 M3 family metallopeptidase [Bacteroidales bacterium]